MLPANCHRVLTGLLLRLNLEPVAPVAQVSYQQDFQSLRQVDFVHLHWNYLFHFRTNREHLCWCIMWATFLLGRCLPHKKTRWLLPYLSRYVCFKYTLDKKTTILQNIWRHWRCFLKAWLGPRGMNRRTYTELFPCMSGGKLPLHKNWNTVRGEEQMDVKEGPANSLLALGTHHPMVQVLVRGMLFNFSTTREKITGC